MQRKRVLSAAVLLTVVLAGGAGFALLSGSASKSSAALPPPPVPVVAGIVAQHDVPIYLTGVGTVVAYNTVVVRSGAVA
jgi:multidrug efflux system membrane fusion protein